MKTVRLDIVYPKRLFAAQNGSEAAKPELLSLNVILSGVNLAYGDRRMPEPQLRMWGRIKDALMDDDGKPVSGPVELSDEQHEWLLKSLKEANYPPDFADILPRLLDALEGK